jgi:hypothetical protein
MKYLLILLFFLGCNKEPVINKKLSNVVRQNCELKLIMLLNATYQKKNDIHYSYGDKQALLFDKIKKIHNFRTSLIKDPDILKGLDILAPEFFNACNEYTLPFAKRCLEDSNSSDPLLNCIDQSFTTFTKALTFWSKKQLFLRGYSNLSFLTSADLHHSYSIFSNSLISTKSQNPALESWKRIKFILKNNHINKILNNSSLKNEVMRKIELISDLSPLFLDKKQGQLLKLHQFLLQDHLVNENAPDLSFLSYHPTLKRIKKVANLRFGRHDNIKAPKILKKSLKMVKTTNNRCAFSHTGVGINCLINVKDSAQLTSVNISRKSDLVYAIVIDLNTINKQNAISVLNRLTGRYGDYYKIFLTPSKIDLNSDNDNEAINRNYGQYHWKAKSTELGQNEEEDLNVLFSYGPVNSYLKITNIKMYKVALQEFDDLLKIKKEEISLNNNNKSGPSSKFTGDEAINLID